jgi:hypothetical protein
MTDSFDVNLFLTELRQWARHREVCRVWGCAPEEADRLDTPLRWAAWDVWVQNESGTAQEFVRECRRVLDVFRDAADRLEVFSREFIREIEQREREPRLDEYPASRFAIIAGDTIIRLLPFHPSMVACMAAEATTLWSDCTWWIRHYVRWTVIYRFRGWASDSWANDSVQMATLYARQTRSILDRWQRRGIAA